MNHLLTATLFLFLLWPAYAVLLRYSDRYALNRCLLLLAMAAVCALPFVSLPSPAPVATQSVRGTVSFLEESVRPGVASLPVEELASADEPGTATTMETVGAAPPTITLPLVYGVGVGLLLLVLGVRLLLILALHLRSRPNEDGTYRLLHPGASPGQAFTFGRILYFSEDVPQDADFQHILAHERVHARQGHTLDILLSEFFLCLFWFHPAAWWLRSQMRANLEYLVDKAVVSGGADRRSYQLALVRQSQGAYGLALALPFSEPSLKSRIARMTGLPEYRVVALLAAVALVFWLGVTLLVVNGTVFGDEPPVGREYLEAAAHPGDPYYDYYQRTLPEELTSLEIYTSRMVTVDEYLQLRAILGKVPGAKLFVYRNAFDPGYSLELRFGNHEPAVAGGLKAESSRDNISALTLELNGGPGLFVPISVTRMIDRLGPVAEGDGMVINHRNGFSAEVFVLRDDLLTDGEFGEEVQVYANRERVDLLKQPDHRITINDESDKVSVRINDVEISDFGADDWSRVVVEGHSQPTPLQRIRVLLDLPANIVKPESFSHQTAHVDQGTYRKWYENLRHLKDQPTLAYYNDRPVELDLLLDNEFGENSIIQHAVIYDTPMGRYAVQVIDDDPGLGITHQQSLFPEKAAADAINIDANKVSLFFRRLPTPMEVATIRPFLANFPDFDLRVFQDCKNAAGDYTLYLGDESGTKAVSAHLAVDEVYNGPQRFDLNKDELGGPTIDSYLSGAGPREAPASEVYLLIDGVFVNIHSDDAEPYSEVNLDPAPDATALQCKLISLRTSWTFGDTPLAKFWSNYKRTSWTYHSKSYQEGLLGGLHVGLEMRGFGDRSKVYYINDELATKEEFGQYRGGKDAYVRMGTWANIDEAPVIMEIVD